MWREFTEFRTQVTHYDAPDALATPVAPGYLFSASFFMRSIYVTPSVIHLGASLPFR
jgi:hypothetical protein